jgi:putative adenylate-forming enzyme
MRKLGIVLTHYMKARLGHRRWKDAEHVGLWQEERIVRHIEWVRARSPFYRELWAGKPAQEWRTFPVINKAIMMENFDGLNTAGIRGEEALAIALKAEKTRNFTPRIGDTRITVGLSSGTSGNRGLFLVGEEESWAWAGTVLGKVLPGPLWRQEKVAFFLRANSNLYESVRGGRLIFRFFDLLTPIEIHLGELNQYQPTLLIGPPSMLRMLAEAAREGRLRIGRPGKIIAVAEVLDPVDEAFIQEVFEQRVHQIYQCTEGFLAATCSHGTLHLNEDLVHIGKDYVDEASGRFSPVITDFSRSTQPMIRYKLDDVLLERSMPCPCSSPFTALTRIEGRCDDLFYWPRLGDGQPTPVFPDYITRSIIRSSDTILEYRAIQHSPERMEVQVRLQNGIGDWRAEELHRQLHVHLSELGGQLGCRLPELRITHCLTAIHPEQQGRKLRRVERRFPIEQWDSHLRV